MTEEKFLKLLKAVTQPEKAQGRVLDALHALEDFDITHELLVETQAAKKLRKAAKTANQEISSAATKVLDRWRLKLQTATKSQSKLSASSKTESGTRFRTLVGAPSSQSVKPKVDAKDSSTVCLSVSGGDSCSAETRLERIDSRSLKPTGDKIRDSARGKFVQILTEDDASLQQKCIDKNEAACRIEKAIFDRHGPSSSSEYKDKFRTLMFNIQDRKNGPLRQKILMGQITGEELVTLRTEELANEDTKRANNTIREKSLRDCERGNIVGATTDAFTCGKCRQSKCTYYQMQTRSADEPMTVYITCTVCRNRWKQ